MRGALAGGAELVQGLCVGIVFLVGVLHLLGWDRGDRDQPLALADAADEQPAADGQPGGGGGSGFTNFAMQIVKDNPEMLQAGLDFAKSNPNLVKQGATAAQGAM